MAAGGMASENRRTARYPVNFEVVCRWKGGQQEGRALDLSRGGLLIASQELLRVGALVEVSFALPGAEPIIFKALVRHASVDHGTGIEFAEVLPHHQARLFAYLDRLDAALRAAAG